MDHSELRAEAKLAVRAYAKDPSERNAVNAELAWERLREHNSSAIWRRMKDRWLEQDTAPQSEAKLKQRSRMPTFGL